MTEYCEHIAIEHIAIIGMRKLSNGDRERFIEAQAMQCACGKVWKYVEPDDLPHWLYEQLKEQGTLPMPRLTPEIMEALIALSAGVDRE